VSEATIDPTVTCGLRRAAAAAVAAAAADAAVAADAASPAEQCRVATWSKRTSICKGGLPLSRPTTSRNSTDPWTPSSLPQVSPSSTGVPLFSSCHPVSFKKLLS